MLHLALALPVGASVPSYDTRGNLSGGNGASYFYDAINRMVGAAYGTNGAAFAYDALNRCVRRTINGVTTYLYYDGWHLIEERNDSDQAVARYVHGQGVDEVLMMDRAGTNYFYHADALGSVTHLTDGGGNLVEKYTYDVFGTPSILSPSNDVRAVSIVGNRFLFTGREHLAELALYDYRNRVYSAALGRFMQTDPIGFAAGDVNLYRYCDNNPVNLSDPDGLTTVALPSGWQWVAPRPGSFPKIPGWVGWGVAGVGAAWWVADQAGKWSNEVGSYPWVDVTPMEPTKPCKLDSADTTDPDDEPPLPTGSVGGTPISRGGIGGIGAQSSPATPPGPNQPPQMDNKGNGKQREHERQRKEYGQGGYKELQNGRIRYYGKVKPSGKPGEMVGRRIVREWNPKTGAKRTWFETLDQNGRVRIVRPETVGPKLHRFFDANGNYIGTW